MDDYKLVRVSGKDKWGYYLTNIENNEPELFVCMPIADKLNIKINQGYKMFSDLHLERIKGLK